MICIIYITHTIQRSNREFDSTTIRIWPPISQQKKIQTSLQATGISSRSQFPGPSNQNGHKWPQPQNSTAGVPNGHAQLCENNTITQKVQKTAETPRKTRSSHNVSRFSRVEIPTPDLLQWFWGTWSRIGAPCRS